MRYFIPTEVICEKRCVMNHSKDFARYGKKCLIVTGKNSAKVTGALEDVISALNESNVGSITFDEIEENPSVETVMKARQIAVDEGVEFIVGIGGGSPLDASKAIALMTYNKDRDESLLYTPESCEALPVVAIPTTAGTGSEVTPYAILTLHKDRTKKSISHKIFPELALVDSKYLESASKHLIVNTAIDALAHLIESNLNTNANTYNKMFSEQGMYVWKEAKQSLLTGVFNEEVYDNLMNASTIAGMAISHTATSLPHGLSYMITYENDIPHGKAVGIYLPGFLKEYAKHDVDAVENVLKILEFDSIDVFEEYINQLLGKVEISKEMKLDNAELIGGNKAKLANYPFIITKDELANMY